MIDKDGGGIGEEEHGKMWTGSFQMFFLPHVDISSHICTYISKVNINFRSRYITLRRELAESLTITRSSVFEVRERVPYR